MISFSPRPRLWRELLLLAWCWPVAAGDSEGDGHDTANAWLSSRGLFVSDPIYRCVKMGHTHTHTHKSKKRRWTLKGPGFLSFHIIPSLSHSTRLIYIPFGRRRQSCATAQEDYSHIMVLSNKKRTSKSAGCTMALALCHAWRPFLPTVYYIRRIEVIFVSVSPNYRWLKGEEIKQ